MLTIDVENSFAMSAAVLGISPENVLGSSRALRLMMEGFARSVGSEDILQRLVLQKGIFRKARLRK